MVMVVTAIAAFSSFPAMGDDVLRFDVTGVITPACDLAADQARIDLGVLSASDLVAVGATGGWHPVAFSLIDCVGASRAQVTVRAPAEPGDPRYLRAFGGAQGVAIELRSGAGKAILPDGATPVPFDVAGPAPELRFEARYVRVGPLVAGEARARALVQITWE
ncbi:MAG: fimbrial protein [Luteibacter sp.]